MAYEVFLFELLHMEKEGAIGKLTPFISYFDRMSDQQDPEGIGYLKLLADARASEISRLHHSYEPLFLIKDHDAMTKTPDTPDWAEWRGKGAVWDFCEVIAGSLEDGYVRIGK